MPATYIKIGSVELSASTSAIEFTNIPNTYKDLVLFTNLRTTNAGTFGVPKVRFNGATTDANMDNRAALADSLGKSNSVTTGGYAIRRCPGGNITADYFGTATVWFADYASTTKHKFFTGYAVSPATAGSDCSININGSCWSDTSAISSIKIIDDNGSNFAQYSSAWLYGISNS